jgi:hypothetical protein
MLRTRTDAICFTGDQLQQEFRCWLSPPDPSTNHNIAQKAHHTGTASWFTESKTFWQWKLRAPYYGSLAIVRTLIISTSRLLVTIPKYYSWIRKKCLMVCESATDLP